MTDTITKPKRGWAAYHAYKRQDRIDHADIIAGLLNDLGRKPTTAERIDAEVQASNFIDARRLERQGRHSEAREVRNQITRAQRVSAFKPRPPEPAKSNAATAGLDYMRLKSKQLNDETAR